MRSGLWAQKRRPLRAAKALILVLALSFGAFTEARAGAALVVAIGADNVFGSGKGRHSGGVRPDQAFPAQLQALLRAQGIDAHVINAGVAGDTTPDILARLDSAVPDGTRLVILDRSNGNDRKAGLRDEQGGMIGEMRSRLDARHIPLLVMPAWEDIPGAITNRDPDGHHFTAKGHAQIAAFLEPRVVAILQAQQP